MTVATPSGYNSDNYSGKQAKNIIHSMASYDGEIMIAAAIMSLLLVTIFVLLLQLYAKWFLTHTSHPHPGGSPVAVTPHVGGRLIVSPHFPTFHQVVNAESTFINLPPQAEKNGGGGVARLVISSIPLFVWAGVDELECSVCLGEFEEGDVGRKLPKCCHAFHAECIEMWLRSNSTCPLCRAPVAT